MKPSAHQFVDFPYHKLDSPATLLRTLSRGQSIGCESTMRSF